MGSSGEILPNEAKRESTTNEREEQAGGSCVEQVQQVRNSDVLNENHLIDEMNPEDHPSLKEYMQRHSQAHYKRMTSLQKKTPDSSMRISATSEVDESKVSFLLKPSKAQQSIDIEKGGISGKEYLPGSLSEQQSQQVNIPDIIRNPSHKEKNHSLTAQTSDIVQPERRNNARSVVLDSSQQNPVCLKRDSLQIPQTARRRGTSNKSTGNKARHDSIYVQSSVGSNLQKPVTSARDSLHITQPAQRKNISCNQMQQNTSYVSNSRAEARFNEILLTHKSHIHSSVQHEANLNAEENTKISKSMRPNASSVNDKLMANLTSAWYWTGYYAGYQERMSEE